MNRTGLCLALLSAVLFGISTPFAKMLLGDMTPQMAAGLLYLGSGVGLALVLRARAALRLPTHDEAPLTRADLPCLLAVIAAGGVAGPLLLMVGLARTDAASASLLLNLESMATLLIAWVVFRENVDRRLLFGAGCILLGAGVLSWQGQATFAPGALYIAAACLCWGIDNNLSGRLSAADPVRIAMIKGVVAGSVNLLAALVFQHAAAGSWHYRRRRWRRVPGLWGQPCAIHAGVAPSWCGTYGGLFRACALCRRAGVGRAVPWAGRRHAAPAGGGRADGNGAMAAPERTPRPYS
ncbi:DMT family transporter [Komagataeibacter kakiaceti]